MASVRIPNPVVLANPSLAKRTTYCNQPAKLAFHTERAARAALRNLRAKYPDIDQEPYRCACGRFHLASRTEDDQ